MSSAGLSSIGPETWNKPYTPRFSGATRPKTGRFDPNSPGTGRITRIMHPVRLCSHQQSRAAETAGFPGVSPLFQFPVPMLLGGRNLSRGKIRIGSGEPTPVTGNPGIRPVCRYLSSYRYAPVHRAEEPWRPLKPKPFDLNPPERPRSDQRLDILVEPTAVTQSPLDRGEPSLPSLNPGIVAQTVLQEEEASPGLEHPTDLGDRLPGITDAAQRPGAHHAVKAPVLERLRLPPAEVGGVASRHRGGPGRLNPAKSSDSREWQAIRAGRLDNSSRERFHSPPDRTASGGE